MSIPPPGPAEPLRVVYDCTVFLQGAARENGTAGVCLQLFVDGLVTLLVSTEVLAEVENVLSRPKVQRKFQTLTPHRVESLMEDLRRHATMLVEVPEVFQYPRDPKDEKYVNLALFGEAALLMTWDNDLLDLMREDLAESRGFQARFPHLRILDPETFLREMQRDRDRERERSKDKGIQP